MTKTPDDRFYLTAYLRGYHETVAFQRALRKAVPGLEAGITQGGLSVWGEWAHFEAFAAFCEEQNVNWIGGPTQCRSISPDEIPAILEQLGEA